MVTQQHIIIAATVFLVTYGLIISEKLNRTVIALAGAGVILFLGVISQQQAIKAIDFNTLGLLTGMMIIVGITRRSGVFEFLAILAVRIAKGDPWKLMLSLALFTAVLSAFLDNVTTVLLIVPITIAIVSELGLDPKPFLISQIMAANIGGTATLIGDPPNIMIGSAAGLSFNDFIINLFIPVALTFIATMGILKVVYRRQLNPVNKLKLAIQKHTPSRGDWEVSGAIKDVKLLKKCVFVLTITILGFLLHQAIHLEGATIALGGATLLLLLTKEEPEGVLLTVEWPTIFFFMALFILVGALEQVGIINLIATQALQLTGNSVENTALTILWLSGILSAFVDNIPFVAASIPLVQQLGQIGGMTNLNPVWWALSLGACLGGNGTLVGASANIIVAGLAEKQGILITFRSYLKVAFPIMILSLVICTIYLYLAFFL